MNPFIVLEGLSGSGKTTIGKSLAERLSAVFYKTPPDTFTAIRDRVDEEVSFDSRFLFYIAGLVQASIEIRDLLQTKAVVCDRYLPTTLCFHSAMGVDVESLTPNLDGRLVKPNFCFLITCPDDLRLIRMGARGLSINDKTEQRLGIDARILREYRAFSIPEIDNSSDDPEVAVEEILRRIKKRQ